MGTSIYREAWLQKAVKALGPLFAEAGVTLPPKVQVSVGFPGGGSARKRIGECWNTASAEDGVNQIFISPRLDHPVIVLATLAHELIHAADNNQSGHKGAFRKAALSIGLEGPMTATVPGDDLIEKLKVVSDKLGEYPHRAITMAGAPKQSTRMLKLACADGSGYIVRMTRKWLEDAEYGEPFCPCHGERMVQA